MFKPIYPKSSTLSITANPLTIDATVLEILTFPTIYFIFCLLKRENTLVCKNKNVVLNVYELHFKLV